MSNTENDSKYNDPEWIEEKMYGEYPEEPKEKDKDDA